jgi:DNA-binding GntR family transcriptional regulator
MARDTIGDTIARTLRQDILLGRLRPNERLTQDDISLRFDTSRMPARDAIRQLIEQGLLHQQGRVVRVAPLSIADVEEFFELDGALHGIAARRAAQVCTPELAATLRSTCDELKKALNAEDAGQATALNWEFHRHINQAGASLRLRGWLRYMNTPREFISEVLYHKETIINEHEVILECVVAGDGEGAAQAASDHVRGAAADLIQHLRALRVIDT